MNKCKKHPDAGLTKVSKRCKECESIRSREWYASNKEKRLAKARQYYHANKDAIQAQRKRHYESHPGKKQKQNRKTWLKSQYGLNLQDYDDIMQRQDGLCAICFQKEKCLGSATTCEERFLTVDHCHESGEIRGLLCRQCNLMLGACDDKTQILSDAIAYLNK